MIDQKNVTSMNRSAHPPVPSEGGAFRQLWAGVGVAAMLSAMGMLHVATKMAALNSGYRLGKVEDGHRLLERENTQLKLQLATLRSASRLEHVARTTFGMVTPSAQSVFQVGGPVVPVVRAPLPLTKPAQKPHASAAVALLGAGSR